MNGSLYDNPVGALDPRSMALAQIGMSLMQSGGPSKLPVSLGQGLGQAGMQGLQAFQQTQQANQQQQMHALRMAEVQREAEERKKREAAMAALSQDPRFAGLGSLLQVAPQAAIDRAIPKATPADSPFAKVNPKDYTRDSVQKFSMTRNPADLVPVEDPAKKPSPTELSKLIAERDALKLANPNDPNLALFDQKIKKLAEPNPPISITNLPPDKKFEWEDKLRSDYKSDVKAFREVEDAHRIIKGALLNPSPANDMAAATKFMKLLDPGSVVRESELAMAIQASGMLDRMSNYHNMLLKGQKLTPTQREDFAKAADLIYGNVQAKWGEMDRIYDDSAKAYGLDSTRIKMGGGSKSSLPIRKVYNLKTGKFE